MSKKRLIVFLIFLISVYSVYARYQVSIPFSVDTGGKPVASAIVGINISEGSNCVSPFYFNKTTAQYGRGEINVSSSRFIAGRIYTMCFNSTVGSNTLRGKTRFSPGVGDINVSKWVNGSSSRFNTYQLNNGSTFDVIYGRQDGNITTIQITNIIYNGTGIKLVQAYNGTLIKQTAAFNGTLTKQITVYNNTLLKLTQGFNGTLLKLINAYNSTLIKQVTVYNGTLLKVITAFNGTLIKQVTVFNGTLAKTSQVYNGTLLKNFNNSNRGKTFFNNSVFFNGTIQVRTYTLRNGSSFDVIYGARPDGNVTPIGITNIIYNGTGIKLVQAYNGTLIKQLTAFNSTLIKQVTVYNGTLTRLTAVYNGTLLKNFNNSNRGKTYFNNTVFFNGTVEGRTFRLRNGTLFDVIYGRLDGNVTTVGITSIIYNGTGVKLVQVYNGTLAKDKNLVKNNTVLGKTYLNTSSSGLFVSGNITARRYYLTNGSVFDVIYGSRSTINAILNNTAQGKAYINSSLYPSNIRFGTWNISTQANNLTFFANGSGHIQRANQSLPYSRAGCYRINGYSGNLGSANLPGSIHLGQECDQGWVGSYIDINDLNQNTSATVRLMNFFYKNVGPAGAIGLSMSLNTKSSGSNSLNLITQFSGPGNTAVTHNDIDIDLTAWAANNSVELGDYNVLKLDTNSPSAGSFIRQTVISGSPPTTNLRTRGFSMSTLRRRILATRMQVAGMVIERQVLSSTANFANRTYAILSDGGIIQVSEGTPIVYNGAGWNSANWQAVMLGNVSNSYSYLKDILYTQFTGRLDGSINLTKMSKRQYNLSFADYVYVNDTLKIGGNTTHADFKIDKTNFTIKSFNSTAYLNCAYFKSVNDGAVKLICDGVAV